MKTENITERLAELIEAQPDYKKAQGAYVSIYRRSQHFGGPEEGGWWYDRISLKGSKWFPTTEQAEAFLEQAKAEVEKMNQDEAPARARAFACLPDEDEVCCPANCPEGYIPNDWTDGGELFIRIEERAGESDNTHEPTPHYE